MRTPRYVSPPARQEVSGRVLALPSDSHEVFRRDMRQSLARAAAANAIPSAYGERRPTIDVRAVHDSILRHAISVEYPEADYSRVFA